MTRALILFLVWLLPLTAFANFQSELLRGKKRPSEDGVQWTLGDWLTQKNRISLLDEWLALHSSVDWLELSMSGAAQSFTVKTDNGTTTSSTTQNGQIYHTDIYISLLNLRGEYQKTDEGREQYSGAAGLRLLGSSAQSTSLIGRFGWNHLSDLDKPEHWDNQFAEGALQLYIIENMGLQGQYRYYFPTESDSGSRLQGHRVTAGLFLEFLIFRINADYFQEPMEISDTKGVVTKRSVDGFQGGLYLFF